MCENQTVRKEKKNLKQREHVNTSELLLNVRFFKVLTGSFL